MKGLMLLEWFIAVMAMFAIAGCGVSSPNGYVLGTTGYLQEVNRVRIREVKALEVHTAADRAELEEVVNERQQYATRRQ